MTGRTIKRIISGMCVKQCRQSPLCVEHFEAGQTGSHRGKNQLRRQKNVSSTAFKYFNCAPLERGQIYKCKKYVDQSHWKKIHTIFRVTPMK